ncbi:MAG: mercury transporter MerT [Candidimonas sp.]|nr:MAG: mercury transporter MerT [Candidimonas sp.]
MAWFSGRGTLVAGVVSAVGASVCCVLPLVLLALGIGGAWVSDLTAMEPYRPIFVGLTLLLLAFALFRLYRRPRACLLGGCGSIGRAPRRERIIIWIVVVLLLALLAAPDLAAYFLKA